MQVCFEILNAAWKIYLLWVNHDNLSNFNPAALNLLTSIQREINSLSLLSLPRHVFWLSPVSPLNFSFLSVITMWAAANVITKGWGLACCVCVSECTIGVHAQQNAILKSYYQKREHFGRYMTEGSSRHMFAETGTTSQVVIINHHQEKLSARRSAWHAPAAAAMETTAT